MLPFDLEHCAECSLPQFLQNVKIVYPHSILSILLFIIKSASSIYMEPLNKAISLERRKAHSDQILSISVSPFDLNIFATSSDDQTLRIWDLRTNSSVKLIKNKAFTNQLSNCAMSNNQRMYVGCGKQIYGFELRKEVIFVNQHNWVGKQHHDDINHIAFDKGYKYLGGCDDMGDTRLYNLDLETKGQLDQKHTNISFCLDFINPENKPPVCVTSGFDCKLIFWNTQTEEAIREIQIGPIFNQHVSIHSMPLIYSVLGLQSSVLIGTQTGHVACFNSTGSKQPRLLFAASLNKILRMCFANFKKNILITLTGEQTFCLFDYDKRDNIGAPKMLQKVSTKAMGNWIQTAPNNIVLVADKTNELSIFKLKG